MTNNQMYICYYLLMNILNYLTVYKILKVFFEEKSKSKIHLFLVFLIYYVGVSSFCIILNETYLIMIINIIFLGITTVVFQGSILKKVMGVILIFIVSFLVERYVLFMIMYFRLNNVTIQSLVISRIVMIFIAQCLQLINYIKKEVVIPRIQWISFIVFPLGCIVLFEFIMASNNEMISFLCLSILMIFNLLIFYIFDKLNNEYLMFCDEKSNIEEKELENQFYLKEKMIYQNQLHIINESNQKIQILKHDLRGHYFSLKTLLDHNQYEELNAYLLRMLPIISDTERYIDTGNYTISSILNYYIGEARKKGIIVQYEVTVPSQIEIEPYDLSTIFINLLNNAMEALEKSIDEKNLFIDLKYEKGVFFIIIKNSYNGSLTISNKSFMTTKNSKDDHGYGITSIKKSLERYNGEIEYIDDKKSITAIVILYCKEKIN